MFPRPYFGSRYFPPRYWPQASPAAEGGLPTRTFTAVDRIPVYAAEHRGSVFERAVGTSLFDVDRRGYVFDAPARCDVFPVEDE